MHNKRENKQQSELQKVSIFKSCMKLGQCLLIELLCDSNRKTISVTDDVYSILYIWPCVYFINCNSLSWD